MTTKQTIGGLSVQYLDELKESGLWMVRNSTDGKGYGGFPWSPAGEWTTAPDWNKGAVCEGGLFGQGPGGYGMIKEGNRFELCETDKLRVVVEDEKIKTKRAKIVAINTDALAALSYLCDGKFPGSLRGTSITSLPEGLHVGGYLDLSGTSITKIPKHLKNKVIK